MGTGGSSSSAAVINSSSAAIISSSSSAAASSATVPVTQQPTPGASQVPATLSCLQRIFDFSNDQSNKTMLHGAIVVAFIVIQCLGAAGILSGVVTGTATITSVIFLGSGMKLLAGIKDANSWSWKILLDNPLMETAFIILSLFAITGFLPGMILGVTNVIILCGNNAVKRLMHKCAPSYISDPNAEQTVALQAVAQPALPLPQLPPPSSAAQA